MASDVEQVLITSCWDGDTCRAGEERIRIACIDTPERGGPGAADANARTREVVEGKAVGIDRIAIDRFRRTVAEIWTPDRMNLGQTLVDEGHARDFERYADQCAWSR